MRVQKRNEVWDIAKGLGIIFVVAGHGFGGGVSQFVNLFHIPLFLYASGLVFKFQDRSVKSAGKFIYKCMKSLWLPGVLYGCFYVLLHNTFVAIGVYALDNYSIKQVIVALAKNICFLKTEPLESAMWFLTALFVGRCLLYCVLWVSSMVDQKRQDITEMIIVVFIFAMGCIFFYTDISLLANADNACSLLPFMYAGYRMKKVEYRRHYHIIPCIVILMGLLLTGQTLRMSRNEIVNPVFLLLAGGAGILLTFELSSILKNWKIGNVTFSYIGRNTIHILCLHLLAFRFVSYMWIKIECLQIVELSRHPIIGSSLFWGMLYSLIGIVAPLIVPFVKNRIKRLERK